MLSQSADSDPTMDNISNEPKNESSLNEGSQYGNVEDNVVVPSIKELPDLSKFDAGKVSVNNPLLSQDITNTDGNGKKAQLDVVPNSSPDFPNHPLQKALEERIAEYKKAALTFKRQKNLTDAKQAVIGIRSMQHQLEKIKIGLPLDSEFQIPPRIDLTLQDHVLPVLGGKQNTASSELQRNKNQSIDTKSSVVYSDRLKMILQKPSGKNEATELEVIELDVQVNLAIH